VTNFLPSRLFVRRAFTLLVWLAAAGTAYWLHRESAGGAEASGAAEAREFTVSSVETGRLASVEVVPGQRVSHGQVLARMDTGTLQKEIAVAGAEMRELEARVPAEARTLQLSGLEAERAFQREIEEAQVSIETAQAGFARDRAELAGVRSDLARQRDLVARRLTDSGRIPDLEVRLAALEQGVATWPARVQAVDAQQQAARRRLEEWRSSQSGASGGEARREQVRPLELRVARQREYLGLLKKRLDDSLLLAPVDARVTTILARQGSVLTPGDPILTMIAEAQQVVAYADEERGYRVAVGDTASIRPRDRADKPVEGTVTSVAGTVAQFPVRFWPAPNRPRWGREVYIQVDGRLDPGAAVDITFAGSRPKP
jgi:multidrug resistance efflux pump